MVSVEFHIIRHAPVIKRDGFIYGDDADIDMQSVAPQLQKMAYILPSPAQSLWLYSGVPRTYETARGVMRMQGCPNHLLLKHEGFREQNFGALIGQRHEAIQQHLQFIDGKIYAPNPPDGERIPQFIERVARAFEGFRNIPFNPPPAFVVFSHGGTIRACHLYFKNLDKKSFINLDTPPLFHAQYTLSL